MFPSSQCHYAVNRMVVVVISVIRHLAVSRSGLGTSDRFRIQIQERGNRSATGRKDVPASLIPAPAPASPEHPPFLVHQRPSYSI